MPLINAYCTLRSPPALEFPHHLNNRRDRSDPELAEHLNGFQGYVWQQGEKEMTQRKYHLLRHLERVQHHLSLDVDDGALDQFSVWATDANAVCFLPDGTVRDPAGQVLIGPGGEFDKDSEIPYPADARLRKARCHRQLEKLGLSLPPSLPPVIGDAEVELRSPQDVARRMLALFVAAVRAESLNSGDPIDVASLRDRMPLAFAALSPEEKSFVQNPSPEQQQIVNFGWRYEALTTLQWALGLHADLSVPKAICDVPACAKAALANNSEQFVATARLRPANEILDALDQHFRFHWAVRQAQINKQPPPMKLELGVVSERHYALNWLTRFEDKDWDDVDTPT